MAAGEDAPLMIAAREGLVDEVVRLIALQADPNAADMLGETALFEAALMGYPDVAESLLMFGANPCHRSSDGVCAADVAEDAATKAVLQRWQKGLEEIASQRGTDATSYTTSDIRAIHALQAVKAGSSPQPQQKERQRTDGDDTVDMVAADESGPILLKVQNCPWLPPVEVTLTLPRDATFEQVRKGLADTLAREEFMSSGRIVTKRNGTYVALRNDQYVGRIQEVYVQGLELHEQTTSG